MHGLIGAIEVIEIHETLHASTLLHEIKQIVRSCRKRQRTSEVIVQRQHAANDDARSDSKQVQHIFKDRAPDVIEVDIDSPRAMRPQLLENGFGVVIDSGIETEISGEPAAFLVGACDADNAATV